MTDATGCPSATMLRNAQGEEMKLKSRGTGTVRGRKAHLNSKHCNRAVQQAKWCWISPVDVANVESRVVHPTTDTSSVPQCWCLRCLHSCSISPRHRRHTCLLVHSALSEAPLIDNWSPIWHAITFTQRRRECRHDHMQ